VTLDESMLKDRRRNLTYLLLIILIFQLSSVAIYAFEIDKVVQVTRVIDGDSFEVTGDEVRLADASAPEWNMPGGTEATNALFNLISGKIVYLDTDQKSGRGPHDRLIAVVYIKHNSTHYLNVNAELLRLGVVSEDDYTNNEFSPSTWSLFVRYAYITETNERPVAYFMWIPEDPVEGDTLYVSSSGSYDFDGTIVGYTWYLDGDILEVIQNAQAWTWTNITAGVFEMSLTVTDDRGNVSEVFTRELLVKMNDDGSEEVPNVPPIASFEWRLEEGTIFVDASGSSDEDGEIVDYVWYINEEEEKTIKGSYSWEWASAPAGTHNVTLWVYDDLYGESTFSTLIEVESEEETKDDLIIPGFSLISLLLGLGLGLIVLIKSGWVRA